MAEEYIERRDGGFYIRSARVSLDSVVYAFLRGESPEGIAESFPALGLEQIFDALVFYIANREMVDEYLSQGREEFEALGTGAPELPCPVSEACRSTPKYAFAADMRPRFLADADLNHTIVVGVRRREPSIDFAGAREGSDLW
jgi:uncharacterized protein (DUF433 family)